MKNKLLIIFLCLCLVFMFTACGSSGTEETTTTEESQIETTTEAEVEEEDEIADEEYLSQPDMAVFIAVDFADGCGKEDISDTMIEMSKTQTAADALQIFAEAEGIGVDIDVNGNVKSIDGVKGDWQCVINGEKAADGGMAVPEDGADVYWIMK